MEHFSGHLDDDKAKHEQLILSLMRHRTKARAARACGMSRGTVYRCFADPKFMARYRQTRRAAFDESLAVLAKGSRGSAQALVDEVDEKRFSGRPLRIAAASRVLDLASKAMESIEVDEELAALRSIIEELKEASRPKVSPAVAIDMTRYRMTEQDTAEACRLRVAWMGEVGHDAQDIEASLRFNRPQSVAEEQELLDVVRKMLEVERMYS